MRSLLQQAVLYKCQTYINFLWDQSDSQAALNQMHKDYPVSSELWGEFQSREWAEKMHAAVHEVSVQKSSNTRTSKI